MRRVERHFDSLIAVGAVDMVDALAFRAAERPDAPALVMLARGETALAPVTYAALHHRARCIAGGLTRRLARGERVVLSYPTGPEFVAALFGCFLAGMIAVPAPPAGGRRGEARLDALAQDCGAALRLTDVVEIAADPIEAPPPRAPDQIALLQYTSGSTGAPKGVAITHGAIWHNQSVIRTCFDHAEGVTLVGWLPNFHDMGLIGNLLQPLYAGGTSVLMAPTAFMQKPMRWLRAVSDFRAHTGGAPNFAYDLCARAATTESCRGMDLSHWRVAFNGAEPIRAETVDAFAARFAPHGFRRDAFMACYGLAESTLMVTGSRIDAAPRVIAMSRATRVVGCGDAVAGTEVRIDGAGDGGEGEILVRSPSVCAGYWNNPAATADLFVERDGVRWLRTGDLGVIHDGELFLVGRAKDLLILNGRNVHPADIEGAVEVRFAGSGVLRALLAGAPGTATEQAVLFLELTRDALRGLDADGLCADLRQCAMDAAEAPLAGIVLVKPGALPLTSSGKVRRSACIAQYRAGALPGVAYADPGAMRLGAAPTGPGA